MSDDPIRAAMAEKRKAKPGAIVLNSKVQTALSAYRELNPDELRSYQWALLNPKATGFPSGNGSEPAEGEAEPAEGEAEPEATQPERFKIHTAADALQPQPPIDWIIEGLFSAGSVSLLVGDPGSGKTYAMVHAGVCVAIGKDWLNFTTRRGKVLFVDEESGPRRMARRLGEVLRGVFGDEGTPFGFISLAQINLRDPAEAILLQAVIEQEGAQLVFIDALVDVMPGGDENAVQDVHPIFQRLRKIVEETQAAIVVLHHANKAGGYRGSSAMSGAVDLLLQMEAKSAGDITFEIKKARDVEPSKFAAQLHFADGEVWLTPAEADNKAGVLSRAQRWVVDYLTENGQSTRAQIIREPDTCTSRAASDAIYQLIDKKIIYRTNPEDTGQGAEAIYSLKQDD